MSYYSQQQPPPPPQQQYHYQHASATFVPGSDQMPSTDYYMPPTSPELVAPAPQRHMPEMSDHIQEGIANMQLNATTAAEDSAFPPIAHRGRHIPQSDAEFESTLEAARVTVLNSNDPDMQLAWAQDALQYVGICMENEERLQQTQAPRPSQPPVERQIMTDAMNIVAFLADQHHPKAEFMRGMWHEFGRFGATQDKREAFRCYARSADRGYARACYRLGMLYENANDEQRALNNYQRGVQAQDSASLYRLGMITLRGQYSLEKNYSVGFDLIKRSADSIDENAPQGAYVYGMLLARQLPQIQVPDGTLPFDEQEARRYIENAAFCRFSKAQLKMGSVYELASLGCDFDPALSLHYNRLAARQGEPEADMAISKWFLVGSENLFPKNEELAYIYAQRAAYAGLPTAEFALGYFNELGIHTPKNIDIALQWYNKAAASGNKDAKGRIDGISHRQILSKRDHENVALTAIKSQHGSMRGQRPQRFSSQAQAPRIDTISEGGSPSPHPRRLSSLGPSQSTTPAPYPLDNRPPAVPPPRSSSTAPYPLDDMPPRLTPVGGFLDTRPATVQPASSTRPSSSATLPSQNRRPVSNDPRARPSMASQQRTASNPVMPQRPATTVNNLGQGSSSPRLDIGYQAPVDDNPPPSQRHNTAPPAPAQNMHSPYPNTAAASRPPPRVDSATPKLDAKGSGGSGPGKLSPKPPTTNARPVSVGGGKGPKTFEEMGVPKQKQDQECIMM